MVASGSFFSLLCQACASVSGAPAEPLQIVQAAPESAPVARLGLGDTVATRSQAQLQIITPGLSFSGVPIDVAARLATQLSESTAANYADMTATDLLVTDNSSLNWSGAEPLVALAAGQAGASFTEGAFEARSMTAEFSISTPAEVAGLDFDVGVAPRISVSRDGDLSSRRVGGEVRVGQGLDSFKSDGKAPKGWYMFAGADGEALIWDTQGKLTSNFGDVSLRDHVTVGDMQAGVSVHRGGGELSFSYIRREVKYDDRNRSMETTEDFAGISFTMKR